MKNMPKIMIRTFLGIIGIIIILVIGILMMKIYNRDANRMIYKNGIEHEEFVLVNGMKQWILMRGENQDNPIILFIHGGPGSPESGLGCKKYQGILEKSFVVVHWEQRGAGKSYDSAIENQPFSVDTYVNDALQLSEYLCKVYNKHKIYVIGHSWGSIVGIKAISKRPDLFYAYIGTGQQVNTVAEENLSKKLTMEYLYKNHKVAAYNKLDRIGEAPYRNGIQDIFLERKYLNQSGGTIGPNYSMSKLFFDVLFFPYYSFADYYRAFKGAQYSLFKSVNPQYWEIAFDKTNTKFDIPVLFIMGENDYTTPTSLVKQYYEKIKAPVKEFYTIEDCAHLAPMEAPKEFNNKVVEFFGANRK